MSRVNWLRNMNAGVPFNEPLQRGRDKLHQTPPTFLLQAEDDPTDPVENSLVYYAGMISG